MPGAMALPFSVAYRTLELGHGLALLLPLHRDHSRFLTQLVAIVEQCKAIFRLNESDPIGWVICCELSREGGLLATVSLRA